MSRLGSYHQECPHCKSKVKIRSSRKKHVLLKIMYLQCTNHECSWSGKANFEITHQLSPSSIPDPSINIPAVECA